MKEKKPFHDSVENNKVFNTYGYAIVRNPDVESYVDFKKEFSRYLQKKIEETANILCEGFSIEKYHEFIKDRKIDHHELISTIGRKLPDPFLKHKLIKDLKSLSSESLGSTFKLYKNNIEFRVVRPNEKDNNPLHRDHWFPYFAPLVNIYVPLSGSYYDSSLCIVPFSHKWDDKEVEPTFTYNDSASGKKTKSTSGVFYSVPEIKSSTKMIETHRPDVLPGDFMLFSPLTVHGGATNGAFETRFSLEMRLEVLDEQ